MLEKTMQEFLDDAEHLLIGAVVNDDFLKVKTSNGKAVIISEAEWKIMCGALEIVLCNNRPGNKKCRPRW